MDQGERIAAEIKKLVTKDIAQQGGKVCIGEIMRGIGSAFVTYACEFNEREQAKEWLMLVADQLDDRADATGLTGGSRP